MDKINEDTREELIDAITEACRGGGEEELLDLLNDLLPKGDKSLKALLKQLIGEAEELQSSFDFGVLTSLEETRKKINVRLVELFDGTVDDYL